MPSYLSKIINKKIQYMNWDNKGLSNNEVVCLMKLFKGKYFKNILLFHQKTILKDKKKRLKNIYEDVKNITEINKYNYDVNFPYLINCHIKLYYNYNIIKILLKPLNIKIKELEENINNYIEDMKNFFTLDNFDNYYGYDELIYIFRNFDKLTMTYTLHNLYLLLNLYILNASNYEIKIIIKKLKYEIDNYENLFIYE